MRPHPDHFRFWYEVDVRFKDIDVGGHAHHSVALVYFEEARARYWKEITGKEAADEVDFILAEARIRYHARILYPWHLSVGVRVSALGKKHFVMEYLVRGPDGQDLASGETTMVMYDYARGKTMGMPQATREAIRLREGESLANPGTVEGEAL